MNITPAKIEKLVKNFYSKVNNDEMLGYVFNDVAKVDWQTHIPMLCKFWNSVLLQTGEYRDNAYQKHVDLSAKTKISTKHFERWLAIFTEQVNADFDEDEAKFILSKAHIIARSLKMGVLTPPTNIS